MKTKIMFQNLKKSNSKKNGNFYLAMKQSNKNKEN